MNAQETIRTVFRKMRQWVFHGSSLRYPGWLERVRSRPCTMCGRVDDITAHHIFGSTGSLKSNDIFTVPLCPLCHAEVQDAGAEVQLELFSDWFVLYYKAGGFECPPVNPDN